MILRDSTGRNVHFYRIYYTKISIQLDYYRIFYIKNYLVQKNNISTLQIIIIIVKKLND